MSDTPQNTSWAMRLRKVTGIDLTLLGYFVVINGICLFFMLHQHSLISRYENGKQQLRQWKVIDKVNNYYTYKVSERVLKINKGSH